MIIGVAGGSGSGKSTFTNRLEEKYGNRIVVIHYDNYYKCRDSIPVEERTSINYDHPDSLDTELLVRHLNSLCRGEAVDCPLYDFRFHTRSKDIVHIEPKPVILVEGILLFQSEELNSIFDLKIYVDADSDERALRRVCRDVKERGRDIDGVVQQYLLTVKPMHYQYVEPTKSMADIVINSGLNENAFELVSMKIEQELANDSKAVRTHYAGN